MTFGKLTVLYFTEIKNGHAYWNCQCNCGNIIEVIGSSLTTGDTKSCGKCQPSHFRNLTGEKFGLLTPIEPTKKRSGSYVVWKCQCDCGNECEVPSGYLTMGQTKSCGCLSLSYNEYNIMTILAEEKIEFTMQKTFSDCILPSGRKAIFDFYIDNSYIIEFDGIQHFSYRENQNNSWNSKENFYLTRRNDKMKNKYCFEHNIPLIRIPYNKDYSLADLRLETTRFLLTPENEIQYYQLK